MTLIRTQLRAEWKWLEHTFVSRVPDRSDSRQAQSPRNAAAGRPAGSELRTMYEIRFPAALWQAVQLLACPWPPRGLPGRRPIAKPFTTGCSSHFSHSRRANPGDPRAASRPQRHGWRSHVVTAAWQAQPRCWGRRGDPPAAPGRVCRWPRLCSSDGLGDALLPDRPENPERGRRQVSQP
jgi:hypothetical protein